MGPKRARRDGGSTDPSRTAAIGGTRVARNAGQRLATSVTRVPTTSETTIVLVAKTSPVSGRVTPSGLEQGLEALGEPEPDEEPERRGEEPRHGTLEDHGAPHLACACADRPQGGELPRALRDGDRERVRDHEGADEERDPAEGEQDVAEHVEYRAEVADACLRLLRRGAYLRVRRKHGPDLREQRRARDVRFRGDVDLVELARLGEERLCGRQVEDRERRSAERGRVAVVRDARDREVLLAAARG